MPLDWQPQPVHGQLVDDSLIEFCCRNGFAGSFINRERELDIFFQVFGVLQFIAQLHNFLVQGFAILFHQPVDPTQEVFHALHEQICIFIAIEPHFVIDLLLQEVAECFFRQAHVVQSIVNQAVSENIIVQE